MPGSCLLQSIYAQQVGESSPHFEQVVGQFFKAPEEPIPEDIVEECLWHESLFSDEGIVDNWKQLLAVNLLYDAAKASPTAIAAKVRLFERHPWNQSSQYVRALVALNHAFAKMPIPEVGPHLLESGAALIDLKEYAPWLSLPFIPHHFEFGICLSLLALMTQRQDLRETVLQLAHWQLNTLDASGQPLIGLFVREKEGHALHHLCVSYLFFRGAAALSEENAFTAIADASGKGIRSLVEAGAAMHPLWPLIERWLEPYGGASCLSFVLPESVYDPSTALVGYRTSSQHAFCTLHGGHTGLGALRLGDVEIVSYGPQYLPLGECQGFGIEGNALSDQGIRRSTMEGRRHSFSLRGCTRLVDQPPSKPFEQERFRGIWLEVSQEFKRPHFFLKTTFLGLDGWDAVTFSFFVKATSCRISEETRLLPRTLCRYEGKADTILCEGRQATLALRPLSFSGKMQVIPLAGGDNFWGADFLVAYFVHSEQRHYQWHIGPP